MRFQPNIEELKKLQPINIDDIKYWLEENKTILNEAIDMTSCNKWKFWREDKFYPLLPCIHKREPCDDACHFIEFYKSLQDFIQTIRNEEFYQNQLEIYNKIKHNQKAIFEWIIDIEEPIIEEILLIDRMQYKDMCIEFDKVGLSNLFGFKKIIDEQYNSDEYYKYIGENYLE